MDEYMPLANALMQIIIKAQGLQAAGRDKQALQSYQKAVAAAKKGTEEEFVTINLLGQFYDDTQAEDMAVDCFRRAQSLASRVFGADSLQLAVAIGNEGMVYLNRGDQKKGAPLLDKAAKLLRASDRAKFAALPAYMISAPVSVLCNAAANTMIRGNANEAVLIAKDAFAIAEQNLEVLDPVYMQAGFELCTFMAEAGMRKEEKKLKDKLTETLFGAGCHPSQLLQLMTQVCGNIVGENVLVDGVGLGMFDDPDSDLYLERASNVVPFPGAKSAKAKDEPAGVQLKITLAGVKPPVWRRISIEADASLYDLHDAIQTAMGWTDSHLHEFQIGRYRFGESSDYDSVNDEHDCRIDALDLKVGARFSYMYDFGDGWKHTIEIEKLLTEEELDATPPFVKAKGACPPEDCGGPYGFMQLLEALKGGHANKDMREWLETMELSDYDPNAIPDCFEDQIVAQSKKKAKPVSSATGQGKIKSVTMQPELVAATTKKKSGQLEWPGSR